MSGLLQILVGNGTIVSPTVTWNPADKASNIALTLGNLTATKTTDDAYGSVRATTSRAHNDPNGYYFEVKLTGSGGSAPYAMLGLAEAAVPISGASVGNSAVGYCYYQENGNKFNNATQTAYGTTWAINDVIGVAFKNGKVWFARNGTWQAGGDPVAGTGQAFTVSSGNYFPALSLYKSASHIAIGRFKASDFTQTVPSGYVPWET